MLGYDDFIETGVDLSPLNYEGAHNGKDRASVNAVLHIKPYESPLSGSTAPKLMPPQPLKEVSRAPSPATDEALLQKAIAEMDAEESYGRRRRTRRAG